jgi:predicted TIM-barrel fold metal-dependent hydrolase
MLISNLDCILEEGKYADEYAGNKKLPEMINGNPKYYAMAHCDLHDEKAAPRTIYNLAKRHTNVPVILGHMGSGGEKAHKEAVNILVESLKNNDAKLYVDVSWVDWENDLPAKNRKSIKILLESVKEYNAYDRVLFGTDAPLGATVKN